LSLLRHLKLPQDGAREDGGRQLISFGWLWFDSADKLSAQLNQATTELAGLRNRLNAAGSEVEQRLQSSTIPDLLPPLIPGSLAQQKAQLSESLDLNRSGLQTNLNRQRTSTVVNSLPGTLRVLLGGIFNNGGAAARQGRTIPVAPTPCF